MQNGYIESFNGNFRDECLNEHWFQTLPQTHSEIAIWRQEYNEVRPHSNLRRIPPAEFAQRHRTKSHPPSASSDEIKQPLTKTSASVVRRKGACQHDRKPQHQELAAVDDATHEAVTIVN